MSVNDWMTNPVMIIVTNEFIKKMTSNLEEKTQNFKQCQSRKEKIKYEISKNASLMKLSNLLESKRYEKYPNYN